LQIPVTELNHTFSRSHRVVCPVLLIESLNDIIAMPLRFLLWNSSQEAMEQVRSSRLNWIYPNLD
jgi:hypothetical protein